MWGTAGADAGCCPVRSDSGADGRSVAAVTGVLGMVMAPVSRRSRRRAMGASASACCWIGTAWVW